MHAFDGSVTVEKRLNPWNWLNGNGGLEVFAQMCDLIEKIFHFWRFEVDLWVFN